MTASGGSTKVGFQDKKKTTKKRPDVGIGKQEFIDCLIGNQKKWLRASLFQDFFNHFYPFLVQKEARDL